MKKIIISTLCLVMGFPLVINATQRERMEFPASSDFHKHEITGEITLNGRTFKIMPPVGKDRVKTRDGAPTTPVITTAPGRLQYYVKDAVGYGGGSPIQAYGVAASAKWDDNDLYFLNIITAAPLGTYTKATKNGNVITLPMNQTVLEYDDEEYVMNLGLLRPIITKIGDGEEDLFVWFEETDDYDYIHYTIDPNGSLWLEDLPLKYEIEDLDPKDYGWPYYVIGYYYSDDYQWSGYSDVFQVYDEFNFEPVTVPDDVEYNTFSYINNEGMGVLVYVGETEDALYFKCLSAYAPEASFKAEKISDTRISVAPNQFIGTEADLYYIITSTAYENEDGILESAPGELSYFTIERDPVSGKILSIMAEESKYFLAFNDDPFYFYEFDIFKDLKLLAQDSFAGIPSTPYGVETSSAFVDWEEMGAYYIFFKLSSFAYNGDIIDVNSLYYSIYVNDDLYEFEEVVAPNLAGSETIMYAGIKEPTTLIPYNFYNGKDLFEDSGGTFIVGIYAEQIETLGVQAVYIWDDVTTTSSLVTVDLITGETVITPGTDTKVNTIDSADVRSTQFFDLSGNKISSPSKGLCIKVDRLSDGTVKTQKVMIR